MLIPFHPSFPTLYKIPKTKGTPNIGQTVWYSASVWLVYNSNNLLPKHWCP